MANIITKDEIKSKILNVEEQLTKYVNRLLTQAVNEDDLVRVSTEEIQNEIPLAGEFLIAEVVDKYREKGYSCMLYYNVFIDDSQCYIEINPSELREFINT